MHITKPLIAKNIFGLARFKAMNSLYVDPPTKLVKLGPIFQVDSLLPSMCSSWHSSFKIKNGEYWAFHWIDYEKLQQNILGYLPKIYIYILHLHWSLLKFCLLLHDDLSNSSSSIQFWSGFIPVNEGGRIYPILPAISPTPTLYLTRFFASSFFKPTLFLSFSTCDLHVTYLFIFCDLVISPLYFLQTLAYLALHNSLSQKCCTSILFLY